MKKVNKVGTIDEPSFEGKILAGDIVGVNITQVDASKSNSQFDQLAKSMVTVALISADPDRAERMVTEETKAKVDTELVPF